LRLAEIQNFSPEQGEEKVKQACRQTSRLKHLLFSASVVCVTLAPFSGVPAANAAPPSELKSAGTHPVGLRLAGFDADVARAHGYEVVTLPDGSQASVPAEKAEAARNGEYVPTVGVLKTTSKRLRAAGASGVDQYAELPGDCGKSYIALWDQAAPDGKATLHTGFHLVPAAGTPLSVSWLVNITDTAGSSNQPYSELDGNIWGTSWIGHLRVLQLSKGWANATVVWYSSWTIAANGWFCYSYGPTVGEEIK
jgi:hypothetical protein